MGAGETGARGALFAEREGAGELPGAFLGDENTVEKLLLRRSSRLAGSDHAVGLFDGLPSEGCDWLAPCILHLTRFHGGHGVRRTVIAANLHLGELACFLKRCDG